LGSSLLLHAWLMVHLHRPSPGLGASSQGERSMRCERTADRSRHIERQDYSLSWRGVGIAQDSVMFASCTMRRLVDITAYTHT
jgi:hypothetical protein